MNNSIVSNKSDLGIHNEVKESSLKIKQNFGIFMQKVKIIENSVLDGVEKNIIESQLKNIREKATIHNQENKDEYFNQIKEYERWVNGDDDGIDYSEDYFISKEEQEERFIAASETNVGIALW